MTASFTCPRIVLFAGLAAATAAASFAVVNVLQDDAQTTNVAAEGVASATTAALEVATTTTEAPTTTTTAVPAPTTTAKPTTTTTTLWVPLKHREKPPLVTGCTWAAHIEAGGIGSGKFAYDQLVVDLTNPAWAGGSGMVTTTTTKPATRQLAYNSAAEIPENMGSRPFDANGHLQIIFSVHPYMQGGVFTLAPHAGKEVNGVEGSMGRCEGHSINVDYNGPEGLAGGIGASAASPHVPFIL